LNRNGDFLKEVPVSNGGNFKPLGDRFVGIRRSADRKANYEILDLYDADLKKLKEIYSKKDVLQPGQDILLGKAPLGFSTTANAVFVNPDEDFLIKVFDAEGRYVSTLERDYEPKEISEEEQNAWHKDLEMTFPDVYPRLKHRFKFTSHWAAIRRIKVDGQLLYIITFRKHGDKLECFRYNTSTRLMKKVLLPVAFQSAFAPYPYCIKRGKVYQLVEDATHEKWELRITPFDQT
jgi:hypothetical protein